MSGYWIKIFTDLSKESGSDCEINAGKASWTRGRQDNIDHVILFNKFSNNCNSKIGVLKVPDSVWYQYDRYIAELGGSGKQVSKRIARVVQAEIQPSHVGKYLFIHNESKNISLPFWVEIRDNPTDVIITKEHVNQWITLVLTKDTSFYCLSEKGKFSWELQNI